MLTTTLLLAVTLLQQPRHETPAARAARLQAFDTTKAVVGLVGKPIAEVRSALDVYRRAVFNGTDDEVLHNADYLRTSCEAVDSAAKRNVTRVCRHCAAGDVQAAFDRYRQMLPSLSSGAGRCAARLWRLERGPDAAKRLRQDVRVIGNPLIMTLRGYEARLTVVLRVLNIIPAAPLRTRPPRRSSTAGP